MNAYGQGFTPFLSVSDVIQVQLGCDPHILTVHMQMRVVVRVQWHVCQAGEAVIVDETGERAAAWGFTMGRSRMLNATGS